MSSIEERLARDIAAVTGGVVVNESDLKEARDAVVGRIESDKQHGRRRTVAVAAAAAVLVPVLGIVAFQTLGGDDDSAPPVTPQPTPSNGQDAFLSGMVPTPELLDGVWRVDDRTLLLTFTADGAITFDNGGRLFANPSVQGTYEITDDLIAVSVEGGLAGCAGQTFAMRASLPEAGAMRFVHTQPGDGNCSPAQDERWSLEQVLPTSAGLAELDVPDNGSWKPPAGRTALYGDWLAEGGGYLLELDPEGGYHVAGESGELVDRGGWSFNGSELTLTSSAGSSECSRGDRLVIGGVEHQEMGTTAMQGTVEQDACGGGWGSAVWILFPREPS